MGVVEFRRIEARVWNAAAFSGVGRSGSRRF